MQLLLRLQHKECKKLLEHLKENPPRQGRFYQDKSYMSTKGVRRFGYDGYSDDGMKLSIMQQYQADNETEATVPPWLELRINFHTVCIGTFDSRRTAPFTYQNYWTIRQRLSDMLWELQLSHTVDDFLVSRVDIAADYFPEHQGEVTERIRLLQHSPHPRHMKVTRFGKSVANYRVKNYHSFRGSSSDMSITVYDKVFQIQEENLAREGDADTPMLRVELALRPKKLKRLWNKLHTADEKRGGLIRSFRSLYQRLVSVWNHRVELLGTQLSGFEIQGDYVTYHEAKKQVENATVGREQKERMRQLLEGCHKRKRFADGVELSGGEDCLEETMTLFEQLGISPITLRKDCGFKQLPPLSAVIKLSE